MFQAVFPSSGVQDCTCSNGICFTYTCCCMYSLNSLWWTERPPKTCRVLFHNKINLRNWCIWLVLVWKWPKKVLLHSDLCWDL